MGTYISRSDVETVFGVANVAKWSDKDRDNAEVNADNVAAAIAEAEAEIDDRFRSSRYVVPLTGTTMLPVIAAPKAIAIADVTP